MGKKKTVRFSCVVCPVKDKCIFYDEDATSCVLAKDELDRVMKIDDEFELMKYIIRSRIERYITAKVVEKLSGEVANPRISDLETGLISMIATYLKVKYPERFRAKKYLSKPKSAHSIKEILEQLEEEEGEE